MAIWLAFKYDGNPDELKSNIKECIKAKREFRIATDDPGKIDEISEICRDFNIAEGGAAFISDRGMVDYL